ncbi:MAG: hypothetical protein U5L46_10600 [Agrobacterium sp.]|nr:hypothetical protein [Agrobacterium sp.]
MKQSNGSAAGQQQAVNAHYPCPNSVKYPQAAAKNAMTAAIVRAFFDLGPSGWRGFFGGAGLRNFTTLSFIISSSCMSLLKPARIDGTGLSGFISSRPELS